MITEDYVSYEVAKLLKEKGFDELCNKKYDGYKNIVNAGRMIELWQNSEFDIDEECSAPTLQMALKWLRKKYNIYISIQPDFPSDKDYRMCWCWSANILYENCISTKEYRCYIETYEEAAETAIKYCLEHLI